MVTNLEIRRRVVQAVRVLHAEGLFEYTAGHVSYREPGSDRIYCLGHLHDVGRTFESVVPDDIIVMDLDGKVVQGELEAPGEKYIHTAIYEARPDVGAVVHCHPPFATAFSIAGVDLLAISIQSAMFAPKVPLFDNVEQIDTWDSGRRLAKALGDNYAVLQRGHGVACAARTLEQLCVVASALESTARMQHRVMTIGRPRPLDPSQIENRMPKGVTPEEYFESNWAYFEGRVPLASV